MIAAAAVLAAFTVLTPVGAVSAESAIVIDADSGRILYEKNADDKRLIASTTKIMTALVVIENCGLDETVTVTKAHADVEGSSMYIEAGDEVSVETLLYGLLLASGNDAAAALSEHVAGSMEAFAALMNARAREIGCKDTNFVNSHGLDADEHYSTARDIALIMAEAMKNEVFARISSTKEATVNGRTFKNHNKLLWTCEGCIGGKTGYTKSSGRSLVSCVERGGLRLVCVTLTAPDDWNDHAALYEEAFSAWKRVSISASDYAYEIPVISGKSGSVAASLNESGSFLVPADGVVNISIELKKFVYAPVRAGESAGSVRITADGENLFSGEIVFTSDVRVDNAQKLTLGERIKKGFCDIVDKAMKALGYEPER